MTYYSPSRSRLAIVLGCGDVGSAVAWALHRAGFAVTLLDDADPAWHRRGMAFTNAWYLGNAALDGEGACFCASLKSIPSILARRMIAATTCSWEGIAAAFETSLIVDARGRRRRGDESLRGRVPITIGIGPELADAGLVDTVVPSVAVAPPAPESGPANRQKHTALAVEARRSGRFVTERRIGDAVRTGDIIGAIGNDVVHAPAPGVLLGLAARGARIEPGDTLLEVDPTRPKHACYGIAEDARGTALRVLAECEVRLGSSSCCNTGAPKSTSPVMHEEYPQCASI